MGTGAGGLVPALGGACLALQTSALPSSVLLVWLAAGLGILGMLICACLLEASPVARGRGLRTAFLGFLSEVEPPTKILSVA